MKSTYTANPKMSSRGRVRSQASSRSVESANTKGRGNQPIWAATSPCHIVIYNYVTSMPQARSGSGTGSSGEESVLLMEQEEESSRVGDGGLYTLWLQNRQIFDGAASLPVPTCPAAMCHSCVPSSLSEYKSHLSRVTNVTI